MPDYKIPKLQQIAEGEKELNDTLKNEERQLAKLGEELRQLYLQMGLAYPTQDTFNQRTLVDLSWDSKLFLEMYNPESESEIIKEIYAKPTIFPPLSNLDFAIVAIAGILATVLDILIVSIPKDVNYLNKYRQEGSSLTDFLRARGINSDGKLNDCLSWFEKNCKLPFDRVKDVPVEGFNPKQHRLLGLAHDPLLGIIFGTLDIWNGSVTAIDVHGKFQVIKTVDVDDPIKLLFAPVFWLGHIISDLCTPMGIEIPGWGLLQILQIGSFGEKERTIADLSRYMYLEGYDMRHFLTMSIVPAAVELVVRGYFHLTKYYEKQDNLQGLPMLAEREMQKIADNLKLHKMLFFAHAAASSGNALKVAMYQGNPSAINIDEWGVFFKESVTMLKASHRDRTGEQIKRNRENINKIWEEIERTEASSCPQVSSEAYLDFYRNNKEES